jgi:hypothetical protein
MAAIITEQFRRNSKNLFSQDFQTNNYYIGIGQQDTWDDIFSSNNSSPFPNGTYGDERRSLEHLTGLFKVTANNLNNVIPKNPYDSLTSYKVYDPFDPSCFYGCPDTGLQPCYVMAGDDKLFLCISKTPDATAAGVLDVGEFDEINNYGLYSSADGTYDWVYLGRYDQFSSINTDSFVAINDSVLTVPDDTTTPADITAGAVYGFKIINGGNIYRHPSLSGETEFDSTGTLVGLDLNGNPKTLSVELSIKIDSGNPNEDPVDDSAKIISVRFRRDENQFPYEISYENGSAGVINQEIAAVGFSKAKLVLDPLLVNESTAGADDNILQLASDVRPSVSDRKEAVIIPFIAPQEGFGGIKSETLPSWYVGMFADTSLAPFIPNNTKYHQISLVKNPLSSTAGNPLLTNDFITPLRMFQLDGEGTPAQQMIPKIDNIEIGPGWKILQNGQQCGVIAYIQDIESNQTQAPKSYYSYYYYTDHKYGYTDIDPAGEQLTFQSPDGQTIGQYTGTTLEGLYEPSYERDTGTVLFLDNRSGIQREEGQNEELKLIIQL